VAILVLRAKLGGLSLGPLTRNFAQFALGALLASTGGVALLLAFGGMDGARYLTESALWSATIMAVVSLTMVLIYGTTLKLLRTEDASAVIDPVLRRLPFTRSGNTSS
jgi:hypothetical protein